MENIAVIIVTYNPNLKNLLRLIDELPKANIYISDNGSKNFEKLKKIANDYENVTLINNQVNCGIAVAQNNAMKVAYANSAEFLFFLDQDSFILSETLDLLKKDYILFTKKDMHLGIVSAVPDYEQIQDYGIKYVNEVISSGMFVSAKLAKNVGYMLEELFIDMVDYEWCWRFARHGLKVAKDYNCVFRHQIGNNEKKLGKIIISPFRLYYVFRNSLFLIKKSQIPNRKYSVLLKYRLFKQFIFNILLCPQKNKRLQYIWLGIRDAQNSRMGKLNYDE